jgi:hypothetical protein
MIKNGQDLKRHMKFYLNLWLCPLNKKKIRYSLNVTIYTQIHFVKNGLRIGGRHSRKYLTYWKAVIPGFVRK